MLHLSKCDKFVIKLCVNTVETINIYKIFFIIKFNNIILNKIVNFQLYKNNVIAIFIYETTREIRLRYRPVSQRY